MKKNLFHAGITLHIIGVLAYLAALAYLGTFSRYLSDDYCEAYSTRSSTLQAVFTRYTDGDWRAANRYSNLLFVGFTESLFGWRSIAILPPLMIVLWGLGLAYLVRQLRLLAGIHWHPLADLFFGLLLAYLSILEAPNRFQVLYWRSSMATHFAPLVFINFLAAFLLAKFNSKAKPQISPLLAFGIFAASFLIGGFSEPPVVLMVVGSALLLAYARFFIKEETRRPVLMAAGAIFAGAVSALGVMAASPAVSKIGAEAPPFVEWLQRTVEYTSFFLLDSFKTLPIPVFFSFLTPAFFFFVYSRQSGAAFLRVNWRVAAALPILLALFVAAGFSTSAYGQAYPVERARFFAHALLTATLMLEGAMLGMLLATVKFFHAAFCEYAAALVLLLLAVYPFRAVGQVMQEAPEYRTRAEAWDRRNAHIHLLRENGQTDLVVPQFGGIYGIKELDNQPTHWVNRCAASYYGINTISAVTIHGADALEEYYNDPGE